MGTAGFHRLLIQESPEHTLFGRLCLSLGVAVSQRSFCNLRHRISPHPASGQAVVLGFEGGRGRNANVEELEQRIAPDSVNGVPGESNGNPGNEVSNGSKPQPGSNTRDSHGN